MRDRSVCLAFCAVLLSLLLIACSSNDAPATPPEKGSEVCNRLGEKERLRYTLGYTIESPKQPEPIDPSITSDYRLQPSSEDFKFETTHAGAFQQPDRLDFTISVSDQPSTLHTIRIGESQWFEVNGVWQAQSLKSPQGPFPFTPPNVCQAIVSPLNLAGITGILENVDDTPARHLRIQGAMQESSAVLFGPQSDLGRLLKLYDVDLWLSDKDARLLKVEAVSKAAYPFGRALSVNVSLEVSYNDKDIDIKPPI